jgi:hypothetical protein
MTIAAVSVRDIHDRAGICHRGLITMTAALIKVATSESLEYFIQEQLGTLSYAVREDLSPISQQNGIPRELVLHDLNQCN